MTDFVSGKPIIAMLVPMPIDFDINAFRKEWCEREHVLRKALAVNVVAAT
ncbi:hypothetical protein [Nitrobacter hamburgensis]|nr:hypothetical protein [Nitrobacter hamburgensis]